MHAPPPPPLPQRLPGSFRDPAAFVFRRDGVLHRQLQAQYLPHYRAFMDSGLYDALREENLIIPHTEVRAPLAGGAAEAGATLRPELIPFVSLPHEWPFTALKQAALLTLRIMEMAIPRGLILKDASARNVQFIGTNPIFIDTSSFELYERGPWRAYQQYCEHFLAPLALMSFCSPLFNQLQRSCPDGIPLHVAARALPLRARLRPRLLLHLFAHAAFIGRSRGKGPQCPPPANELDARKLLALVGSLRRTIESLPPPRGQGAWSGYRGQDTYGDDDFAAKKEAVKTILAETAPAHVWDIGANDGAFAAIAAASGAYTIAWESDFAALERCFLHAAPSRRVLPLFFDFNNPSSGSGLMGEEFPSVFDRQKPSLVMLLGIVHHLCITQNIPLPLIADFCRKTGARWVLAEWIEPTDPKAKGLLQHKTSRHPYDQAAFMDAFAPSFRQEKTHGISPTRSLFLFSAL